MRCGFFSLILIFLLVQSVQAQNTVNLSKSFGNNITDELKPFFSPSEGQVEDLLKGDVISLAKVTSDKPKQQQMFLYAAGVHPRNCTRAMRKLSLYENYHNYIDFIKTSTYDDNTQKFFFSIEHSLLPFPMTVKFKIPRITKPGHYPFTFDEGFLKDLKGTIVVHEVGKYCLLAMKADWVGPETKMPDVVFGVFAQTVSKLGLEHLIRVSIF